MSRGGWLWTVGLLGACRWGFSERALGDAAESDAMAPNATDAASDAPPLPNLMFVTSTSQTVCTMGPAAADAVCSARATAAGLPGTYRAWISAQGEDARDRLGTARGWLRVDGRPFGDTVTSIVIDGKVMFPPRIDELGNDVGHSFVESATNADGTFSTTYGCSLGGLTGSAALSWATGILVSDGRLYCFGTDRAAPVVAPQSTGRIAFVSTGMWLPSSGIPSADAQCTSDATAAGLPGTFRAFLPTTTATAASRFDTTGSIWVRPDGLPVVVAASDIASWTLIAPIDLHADGTLTELRVWTGISPTAPTLASTCTDWTSPAGSGRATNANMSIPYAHAIAPACTQALPVFCLQR